MREMLAPGYNNAGGTGQPRRTQRRALCRPQFTKDVRTNLSKEFALAISRRQALIGSVCLPNSVLLRLATFPFHTSFIN